MKRFLLLLTTLISVVFMSCKDEEEYGVGDMFYPGPGWERKSFCFAVMDAEGNHISGYEDFKTSDLVLEYEGKIFTAKADVHQKIDDDDTDEAYWHNSIIFEPQFGWDGIPRTWRIWGHTLQDGKPVQYILRYKDNEWICDFNQWPSEKTGEDPKSELYVNGEKVEQEFIWLFPDHPSYPDPSHREMWRYVLYTK